jgi:hypothetical protein
MCYCSSYAVPVGIEIIVSQRVYPQRAERHHGWPPNASSAPRLDEADVSALAWVSALLPPAFFCRCPFSLEACYCLACEFYVEEGWKGWRMEEPMSRA